MNVRAEAIDILNRWERGGVFAESLVDDAGRENRLSASDRALLNALVMGVLRHRTWLDYIIDSMRPGGKMQREVRALLRLGLCQLLILKIAPHAAVNETVAMAPKKAAGLVNAILRRTSREEDRIRQEWGTLPLPIRFSTPEWLVERWVAYFGEETAIALLTRQQEVPVLYARRNALIPLQDGKIPEGMEEMADLPGWYRICGRLPIEALKAGEFYIADPSTRYAVQLLDPKPEEKILDACAAPGGKTAAISQATEGKALILATDMGEHRLPRLRTNLQKWGGNNYEVVAFDWSRPCPDQWVGLFDGVLLDVPCSNTGVMQRRIDVRWRITEREMERLAALQLLIMENACIAVKRNGRLVYSTCSIDPEEDSLLVKKFLASHPDWKLVEEKLVLPQEEETDGAYAAKLIRA